MAFSPIRPGWLGLLALLGAVPLRAQPCAGCEPAAAPPFTTADAADPGATPAAAAVLRNPPQISLAPHHTGVVNTNTGAAALSYSTPAYVSRDAPRSVGLIYNSTQARGYGFVQVDVTEPTEAPARMSIQVFEQNGTAMTPETFYQGAMGTSRLAATWRENTSAYVYRVVVRSYWADGTMTEGETSARVLVVNEAGSHFGSGWSMPGLQRVYPGSDGDMIVNGDGTAVFFTRACTGCAYVAPDGEFSTLARRADGGWARVSPSGDSAIFGNTGLITRYADRNGRTRQQFTWATAADGWPIVTEIIDPIGAKYTLGYLSSGYLRTITDPGGRVTTVGYSIADVASVTGPDTKYALQAGYDAFHRVTWFKDRSGGQYDVTYDHVGGLAAISAPAVYTTDQGTVQPVSATRSLWAAVLPGPGLGTTSAPGARVVPANVRVTAADPRGNVVKAAVDRYGAPIRIEQPYGQVATIDRNQHGQVTRTVLPTGHTVTATWSGVELTRVVDETVNDTTTTDYEHTWHQPTYVRNGLQRDSMYYGASGQLDSVVSLGGGTRRVQQYSYWPDGRLYSVTDPAGHGAFYSYEGTTNGKLDNVAGVTVGVSGYTNNRTTSYAHDALGRDTMITSPNADKSRTGYDVLNRVVRSTDPLGNSTTFAFDSVGLATVTDAKSQVYRFTRNVLGWVVSETDPRNSSIADAYDRAGNLTSTTNRRGQTVTLAYDSLNRLTTRNAAGAATTWSYDPAGLWTQVQNAESTDRAEFDAAGRLLQTVVTRGSTTYRLQNTLDAQGRRRQLAVWGPWSGAYTTDFRYNDRAQLDTLVDFYGGRTVMTYDADGLWAGPLLPMNWNYFSISRGYVSTHVPSEITHPYQVADVLNSSYGLDKNGLLAARGQRFTEDFYPYNLGTRVTSYTYDRAGRLTRADVNDYYDSDGTCGTTDPNVGKCMPSSAGGIPYGVEQRNYAWDAVGNPVANGTTVLVENGNRLTRTSPFNLEYDADGNLTRKYRTDQFTYDQRLYWNALGQLDSVRTNGTTVGYGYNGLGQRIRAGAKQFLYDGDDLLLEMNTPGVPDHLYTYYPGVDNPHSVRMGNGPIYYYTTDFPGNVVALINKNRQVVARYTYDDFGHSTAPVDSTGGQPLRYAGRELDSATGLYYVRARWYDPDLGRFVSEDPVGLEGGLNLYAYVDDNPVNGRDPSGLDPCTDKDGKPIKQGADQSCAVPLFPLDVYASNAWPFSSPASDGWSTNFGGRGGGTLLIPRTPERRQGGGKRGNFPDDYMRRMDARERQCLIQSMNVEFRAGLFAQLQLGKIGVNLDAISAHFGWSGSTRFGSKNSVTSGATLGLGFAQFGRSVENTGHGWKDQPSYNAQIGASAGLGFGMGAYFDVGNFLRCYMS
ncbi:MAG TPA: RHS repeat-associated core domain-containing protein [Longimicrobium sp.]|nr:RHS repeat-associated core domain-containing protein [Longimicrobium sp.]